MRGGEYATPSIGVEWGFTIHRRKEGAWGRCYRERRLVDATELVGARVHMNQALLRCRRLEQRVTGCRDLSQPLTDDEQHVRSADARSKPRVDADADIAGIVGVAVVEEILVAECAGDGQRVGLGKMLQRGAAQRGLGAAVRK